jgi:2-desacetyl-2-hydroxyethyl bacteriochlorophyllide A dehydrogenase
MKAIVIEGPGDARMREVAKPETGRDGVLAKVAYAGICGTDLAILSGDMSFIRDGSIRYPVRIGHEWSGVVEAVGPDVTRFRPGDRIISDTSVACGICGHCLRGEYALCGDVRSLGTINCWDGAFAEYMLMPERHVYKLPDEISLEEGALFEPAGISLTGLKQCNLQPGSTVLIIGTGPIGLTAIPLAKAMGAGKVFISGRKPFKLAVALQMGADFAVNSVEEDLAGIIRRETDGKGVDAVIETSGNIHVINSCMDLVRSRGIIALIGFYEKNHKDFNIDALVMKAATMKGILGDFGTPREVIDMRLKGNFSFKPLITHVFRLDEAIWAMKTAEERNDTKIKMLVKVSEDL